MSTAISSLLNSAATTAGTTSESSNNALDYDSFLTILSAELKYQDPTESVSSTEYISQMAQLSTLSQMNEISAAINNTSAFSMIGREVAYTVTDAAGDTSTATGTVTSVMTSNGATYVVVNGASVELSAVYEVGAAATDSATA
ncbi:MAG: flagellar hook capping FlgD N-terminal domain-containing protein [Sporomusaceae bacterium]|nr:flagellar hook capping FlgD N-terminal domain-containing protein [Sporomusaceae bacterium]